jgi:septal ring factor EnvC (AmiA/AmiB activator)
MLFFMTMMAREAWTDEWLDDLKENVNQRFDQVDKRFDQVERRFEQVDKRFEQVDKRFAQVDARFDAVNARFDAMQRTMIIGFVSTIGSVVVSVLGGILVTQL